MSYLKKLNLSDNTKKLCKVDYIIMGIMILVYGMLSFCRLGDTKVPNTYKQFDFQGEYSIVALKVESNISKIRYYTGNGLGSIDVSSSIDGIDYEQVATLNIGSVFNWQDLDVNIKAKYVKFTALSENSTLGDVAFYYGDYKVPIEINVNNPLTDETDLIPDEISYMNSTYFDEIYYARSAYEYVHGIDCYEWTHPPLGKLLMSIPILLFGFSPFTYRLMGNIIGILLIPLMYILGKKLFKNRKYAILSALLMMFDTFHFAHTRIALVDGYQVFFIILSVIFMKEYLDLEKNAVFKQKAKNLLLSGTFIGCAIATKWNALYVAMGLAIVFFVHLLKQYDINVIKYLKSHFSINGLLKYVNVFVLFPYIIYYLSYLIINKNIASTLKIIYFVIIGILIITKLFFFLMQDKPLFKLFIVCIISFILIPIIIYVLSFVLFPTVSYYDGTLEGILNMNKMMYDYHANLDATHPFSSSWYQWPIMYRPVWLYINDMGNGYRMTISDIGNPAIWWFGVISFIYLVINSIKKKTQNDIFILVFILSTFIPYLFIGRLMFMYHYFITIPFIMLGIVSFVRWITEKTKSDKFYYLYIVLIVVTFIVFYPIVSGIPISSDYVDSLRWLPEWYF